MSLSRESSFKQKSWWASDKFEPMIVDQVYVISAYIEISS